MTTTDILHLLRRIRTGTIVLRDILTNAGLTAGAQVAREHLFELDAAVAQATNPWHPMDTAPRDGTLLLLLVDFTEHPTEDDPGPAPTIGANNRDHDGEDRWLFAGWCWTHDDFTQGEGTPVGWQPIPGARTAQARPGAAHPAPDVITQDGRAFDLKTTPTTPARTTQAQPDD